MKAKFIVRMPEAAGKDFIIPISDKTADYLENLLADEGSVNILDIPSEDIRQRIYPVLEYYVCNAGLDPFEASEKTYLVQIVD